MLTRVASFFLRPIKSRQRRGLGRVRDLVSPWHFHVEQLSHSHHYMSKFLKTESVGFRFNQFA